MAASAALPAMRWAIASSGSVTTDTTARGQHDIVVDGTDPPIKQFTPFLPWMAGPDDGTVQIQYAALASIMWSATKLQDGSSAFAVELHRVLLAPSKMLEIILKLSELGFSFAPVDAWFLAVDRLVSFVSSRSDAEFKLLEADLEKINIGPVAATAADLRYTKDITLGQFSHPMSTSLSSMGLLEIIASPRIQLNVRNDKAMPYMRMHTQIARHLRQHDTDVQAMIAEGVPDTDINERVGELMPEVLVNLTIPLSIVAPNFFSLEVRCTRRSQMLDRITKWSFGSAVRHDLILQNYISFITPCKNLMKIVMPAANAEECHQSVGMLKNAFAPMLAVDDASSLSSLDRLLCDYVPLVDTDERRGKPGAVKTQLVLAQKILVPDAKADMASQDGTMPSGSSSSNAGSTGQSSAVSAATMAWMLTQGPQSLETEVMKAVEASQQALAINLIGRSRLPLYLQMLVWRDSLGSSEVARSARQLRPHRTSAFSFALTSAEDEHQTLVQDKKFAAYVVLASFDKAFWDFNWGELDPFALLHHITKHVKGSRSSLLSAPGDCLYGKADSNRSVSEIMDRAMYFIGFSNGVFTNFIQHANKVLESAKTLPQVDYHTIQRKVTEAVKVGMRQAGEDFRSVMKTITHATRFPNEGKHLLLLKDSSYINLLKAAQERIDIIDNEDFWDDRKKEEDEQKRKLATLGDVLPLSSLVHAPGFESMHVP